MHDPMTVICDIPRYPRNTIITVWHVDPCKDGSDDSCGWFMRARHGDAEVLAKIEKAFASEWDTAHNHSGSTWFAGWFTPHTGMPIMSIQATALEMFRRAAFIHFGDDWKKTERFMRRNVYGILSFAENTTDSMRDGLIQRFGGEQSREDRIERHATMVYGWILRAEQPWYRHPRWHVHHWRIQVRPWQTLRRWLFDRCCNCGKRFGWGESPITHNWNSPEPRLFRSVPGLFHGDCRNIGSGGIACAAQDRPA